MIRIEQKYPKSVEIALNPLDLDSKWLKTAYKSHFWPFHDKNWTKVPIISWNSFKNWVWLILPKTSWNSILNHCNSYDQNWTKVPKISWNSFKVIGFRLKVAKMHTNPIFDHFMLREGQNWVILPKTSWNSFETNSYDQNWTKVPKISWNSFKLIGFRLKLTKLHKNPIFDHCQNWTKVPEISWKIPWV